MRASTILKGPVRRAASEVTPKLVSPSDAAAQWTGAMRGPAFFAYADVKFGVIMDVEASRAIRQAVGKDNVLRSIYKG